MELLNVEVEIEGFIHTKSRIISQDKVLTEDEIQIVTRLLPPSFETLHVIKELKDIRIYKKTSLTNPSEYVIHQEKDTSFGDGKLTLKLHTGLLNFPNIVFQVFFNVKEDPKNPLPIFLFYFNCDEAALYTLSNTFLLSRRFDLKLMLNDHHYLYLNNLELCLDDET